MDVTLQSKTKPETARKGIKYNNNWHTVVGKAANYIDNLNMGDIISVKETETGDVVFIGKVGDSMPKDKSEMTEKEAIAEDTAEMTSVLINLETMIKQNATIIEMLLKLLKNFNLAE